MKVIGVRFQNNYGMQYHFLTFFDDLEIGDLVVVDTVNGFQVAVVTELDITNFKPHKWVVDKINDEKFNEIKEKIKRKNEITKLLDEKLENMKELIKYKLLAENDETARELLYELEELNI